MGAAGCRKNANFGVDSNPIDPRQPHTTKKLQKNKQHWLWWGSNREKMIIMRKFYHWAKTSFHLKNALLMIYKKI